MQQKLCYSVRDAAELLGVTRNHLYKFVIDGQLPTLKLGQRRLINREALDTFRKELEKRHAEAVRGGT